MGAMTSDNDLAAQCLGREGVNRVSHGSELAEEALENDCTASFTFARI